MPRGAHHDRATYLPAAGGPRGTAGLGCGFAGTALAEEGGPVTPPDNPCLVKPLPCHANAGSGNGSEVFDTAGDRNPGNSAGHNNCGD